LAEIWLQASACYAVLTALRERRQDQRGARDAEREWDD
jgi:hypothetical protein